MTAPHPSVAERVREATRSLGAALDAADSDPLLALRHAADARDEVDSLVHELAARARLWHGDRGASWSDADIGAQLGTTRQAAQQRYGPAADQLLREHIRAGYRDTAPQTRRQPRLTPGAIQRRDDEYLLTCDQVDGWTLWRLDNDAGDDTALGVHDDLDYADATAAQEWAATILATLGTDVTAWTTAPGRHDDDDPGWSPLTTCPPPQ